MTATEQAATRRRLIEAGKREFAERGLAGARFDEISIAAGHAKGTIYNYFGSKEDLFFTIVAAWCELLVEGIDRTDEGPAAPSARDRLLEIATLDVEIARKDPDLARVIVQQMPSLTTSHREAVDRSIDQGLCLLDEVFERGLADGEICSSQSPAALSRLFLGALSAFELEALLPGAAVELDAVVDLVDQHFIAGLMASLRTNR